MRKNIGLIVAAILLSVSAAPASHSQSIRKQLEATDVEFRSGGPRTPAEIQTYLQKMRVLIDRYNSVVYSLVGNSAGGQQNPANMAAASAQTQALAAEIRALQPPDEIANDHMQLATTLGRVEEFLKTPPGPQALPMAFSLISNVQSTMSSYRAGTTAMVQRHRLNPAVCDPFGGETDAQKSQVSGLVDGMKNQMMNPGGGAGGAAGGMMGAAGGMLSGGADALGGLGSMLGGMGGGTGSGGLEGLGDLGKMFGMGGGGGLGGGSGSFGKANSFGSGGSFGRGGSFGSGSSFGSSGLGAGSGSSSAPSGLGGIDLGGGSLDVDSVKKQMGDEQKVIEQLLAE